MTEAFGVDKLCFLLPIEAVKFSPDFDGSVRQPAASSALGREAGRAVTLYHDTSGRAVKGKDLLLNPEDGDYQLAIRPDNRGGGSPICLVQFSAHVFGGSNLLPLGYDEVGEAVLKVQNDLWDRGARLSFERAKLCRVDIARNDVFLHPLSNYMPFAAAGGARKTTKNREFGGTGFIMGPDCMSWQLAIYDKLQEMKKRGCYGADCPPNTLRTELRLMRGEQIKSRLGLSSASLSELRANWPALSAAHHAAVKNELFKYRDEALKPSPYDIGAIRDEAVASGSKAARDNFERALGRVALIERLGLDAAITFESESFAASGSVADSKKLQRIERDLKAVNYWLMLHKPVRGRRAVSSFSLHQEWAENLLRVAA